MALQHHTLGGALSGTLEANGVTSCRVVTTNRGNDHAELKVSRLVDDSDLLAAFDEVTIKRPSGVVVFRGWRQKAPRRGDALGESHIYTLDGPWQYYLEGITYKRPMVVPSNPADPASALTTVQTSKVILFQAPASPGSDPAPWTIQQQIADALDQATGINYDLGDLPTIAPPEDEQRDLTLADVVEICLRWCPAIQCYWDYTTSLPTLRFTAGGSSHSLFADSGALSSIDVSPRADLLVGEVLLTFLQEQTAEVSGETKRWNKVTTQVSTVANGSPRKLDLLIELRGDQWRTSIATQEQRLKVQAIPTSGAGLIAWLQSVVPWLRTSTSVTLGTLAGESGSAVVDEPSDYADVFPGDSESREDTYGAWDKTDPANELLWGSVQPWMPVHAENVVMRVQIDAATWPGGTPPVGAPTLPAEVPIRYTWCDGQSKTYRSVADFTDESLPGEPVPTGLAALLHAGFSALDYELQVHQEEEEPDWLYLPGDLVSVDGRGGIIQRITRDIGPGITSIEAGPTQHLALDNLLALILRNRRRIKALSTRSVWTGGPRDDGGSVIGATHAGATVVGGSGGGGTGIQPFSLLIEDASTVRLKGSTVFSSSPTFSGATADGADWLISVSASGKVWAKITIDSSGAITARELGNGASLPSDTSTTFHEQIGSYTWSGGALTAVQNDRYGPVGKDVCRDWFNATATYGVTW